MKYQVSFQVDSRDAAQRLDVFLAQKDPSLSRSRIKRLIEKGEVWVGGRKAKASLKLRENDVVALALPEPEKLGLEPQDLPLKVLYEDRHLIVVDKPAGLVVHPGAGNPSGTLVNALLAHCGASLSGIGGVKRPGIVHRRTTRAIEQMHIRPGETVLDIGVGTGLALQSYPRHARVLGIDLSEGMLRRAQRRIQEYHLSGVQLALGNALELPFPDQMFDHVLLSHVVTVVSDPVTYHFGVEYQPPVLIPEPGSAALLAAGLLALARRRRGFVLNITANSTPTKHT